MCTLAKTKLREYSPAEWLNRKIKSKNTIPTHSMPMKPQVLQQELFQISEKIKQLDYKIHKQNDPKSKELIINKKERLVKNRQQLKVLLRVVYESTQNKAEQCSVA